MLRVAQADHAPLRLRIHDLAAARGAFGNLRIYIVLREGWLVNNERLYWKDEFSLAFGSSVLVATSAWRTESGNTGLAANEFWSMVRAALKDDGTPKPR